MKRFFTLMALTACCIVCGCDSGEKATPTPGGGGSSTESTTSDPPKAVSNGSLDASEMVKVSLSVPNMT